jgi:hypothetical protein
VQDYTRGVIIGISANATCDYACWRFEISFELLWSKPAVNRENEIPKIEEEVLKIQIEPAHHFYLKQLDPTNTKVFTDLSPITVN